MEFLSFLHFYANHGSLSSGFCLPPCDGLLQTIKLTQIIFTNGDELAVFSNVTEPKNHSTIVKTTVSGLMTNAPFMLNVDCDMYVNNPQVVHQAMCLLLGSEKDNDQCGFVQYPQVFYDGPADQEVILQEASHDILI
ncbi:hypothetical protein Dsin_031684 [Dipteronia sinensis]|uniref:Cellulose synthase n=1 Tax=Dipteronia sinensis TaxID=43782 RepID=A0AAE0DSE9_9ROSI|nr:hypothetical protein Dsin_031684 [Dipteronia sinensis]